MRTDLANDLAVTIAAMVEEEVRLQLQLLTTAKRDTLKQHITADELALLPEPLRSYFFESDGGFSLPDFRGRIRQTHAHPLSRACYVQIDDDWWAIDRGRVAEGLPGRWGRWPRTLDEAFFKTLPAQERALYVRLSGNVIQMREDLIEHWGEAARREAPPHSQPAVPETEKSDQITDALVRAEGKS